MNPSTRRYLPVVAVVALLLVAVYFGQPDRMTGSAVGAGCAGGQGELVAENELGAVESGPLNSVRDIVNFDEATGGGEMASLDDLKVTVEEFGGKALPALLEELRSSGCMDTNSAILIELVATIGELEEIDNETRTTISKTLVDIAVIARNPTSEKDVPEMQADEFQILQERQFGCSDDAFDLVQGWASSTQSDMDDMIAHTQQSISELNDADPAGVPLVELLADIAPKDEEWGKIFEQMAANPNLHKDAQGTACEAAVEEGRDSELAAVRDIFAEVTSPSVAVCVIEESVEWEDSQYAVLGLKNNEDSVRMSAIGAFGTVGGADDIDTLLAHLFSVPDPNGVSADESERNATVTVIAALVAASDTAAPDLLVGASDMAAAMGNDGADWLNVLDHAIPDWDESAYK